jgi:chromosome partitioning protein
LVSETSVDKLIRTTDRPGLFVILGDKKTAIAQTILSIQRSPVSFTAQKIRQPVQEEKFDYVLLDTSPSLGELQEQALYAADLVLIPCTVDYLASDGVITIQQTLEKLSTEFEWPGRIVGILPTFYDEVTRESRATLNDLTEQFDNLVLTPIHRATVLRECAVEGKTIFELYPTCRAASEYQLLVETILKSKN